MNKEDFKGKWIGYIKPENLDAVNKDLDTLIQSKAIEFAEFIRLERYEMGVSSWFRWELDEDGYQRMVDKTSEELYNEFNPTKP